MTAGMRPADIGLLTDVADPRLSPNGTLVACSVSRVDLEANEYRSTVWVGPVDAAYPVRPFTAGEHRDGRARWSPDSALLAFVSHRDDKGSQLFVAPVGGGGETRRLAASPEEIEELEWSPDGRWLAYTTRVRDEDRYGKEKAKDQPPRRISKLYSRLDGTGWTHDRVRQLFVIAADGASAPRAVTEGLWHVSGVAWSPDSEWLAFSSGRHDTFEIDRAVDLWRVRRDGTACEQLTTTLLQHSAASWSPDGARIAVLINDQRTVPRHTQVGVLRVGDPAVELLTEALDRSCAAPSPGRGLSWDGDDVLHAIEDEGDVHVCSTGGKEPLLGGERWVTGFDCVGDVIAFTATSFTAPTELYITSRDGGDEHRVTDAGSTLTSACALAAPLRFTATSPDGSELEAWFVPPVGVSDGERAPTLLNVHGGPFTQYGNRFFDELQLEAGAGYGVLFCNPRGSSGYSEAWGRAIRWPGCAEDPGSGWGGVDYDDLMAVVEAAVERFDVIDSDRLGVLGGSYGGYMTSWIMGHTDRFKAGCSERAVNNLQTLEFTSDIATFFRSYIGPSHVEDPEVYLRHSPIRSVDAMTAPMLLIHSEDDLRCPISQAEELFVALKLLGRDVDLLRFPGEGHEMSRSGSPLHRRLRAEAIIEFFDAHLQPA